jgi:hypothetical protein
MLMVIPPIEMGCEPAGPHGAANSSIERMAKQKEENSLGMLLAQAERR